MRLHSERGSALLTVLLLLSLSVVMLGGFMTMVVTDQRLRAGDHDSTRAFYGAHGALEKLTADLGNLFLSDFSPNGDQIDALTVSSPEFERIAFDEDADGNPGYRINVEDLDGDGDSFDANGNPETEEDDIGSGPFQGLRALSSTYVLTAVARAEHGPRAGSEVHLERKVNTVSIPLFQFGMFSETDLSVFAGPAFDFGGRVHTNGNLFLASGTGPLTLRDRVTVVGELIRSHLSNGWDTNASYNGAVSVIRAANVFRNLEKTEGSLVTTVGSAENEPTWTNISIGTYNGYLRNSRTGARRLDLPFVSFGAAPVDLIKRGVSGEDSRILDQRYYQLASLRILLSDTENNLTSLPGVVAATAPLTLDGGVYVQPVGVSAGNPAAVPATVANGNVPCATAIINLLAGGPFPAAGGRIQIDSDGAAGFQPSAVITYTGRIGNQLQGVRGVPGCGPAVAFPAGRTVRGLVDYATPFATPLLGGRIKIEMQRGDFTWADVTAEILGLGISGRNLMIGGCAEPAPNAVLRLQRLRTVPLNGALPCGNGSTHALDYVPNVLYDTREGLRRDNIAVANTTLRLAGVMHYVELDVRNLSRWFRGEIGASGLNALNVNGYTVYFSDRRTNRNANGDETGEFGYEDFVNPLNADGSSNVTLDTGEDADGDGNLDRYGENAIAVAGSTGNFTAAARPWTGITAAEARYNRAVLFRRALKLTNGSLGNIVMPGLTIASENPVYVEGHYNANAAGFGAGNAAAAVIADSVTMLSAAWNDETSLQQPNNPGGRNAVTTWYRMAVLAGKGRSFPQPAGTAQDFGTDGGAHNFLRFVENWGGSQLRYRGAIASFFYNRQGTGTYKCCNNVYGAPTRMYDFDLNFRQPSLLPPNTPMFRDVNTTAFRQVIRRGDQD